MSWERRGKIAAGREQRKTKMMTFARPAAIAALAALVAAPASAITISNISGTWENADPASAIAGVGTNRISWGTPLRGQQSAYLFESRTPPSFEAVVGTPFVIGDFTHFNFPILGADLRTVDLDLEVDVAPGYRFTSLLSFVHDETVNGAPACTYGGVPGEGINLRGCADSVTATLDLPESEKVTIDGKDYYLDFAAFRADGGRFDSFLTAEQEENVAQILGTFRAADTYEETPSPVPLPAAGWLLLGTLGGLAAWRRRR